MYREVKNLPEEILVGNKQDDLKKGDTKPSDIVIEEGYKSSRGNEVVGEQSVEGLLRDHSRKYDEEMDKVAGYSNRERLINKKLFGREGLGASGESEWCINDELKKVKAGNSELRDVAKKLLKLKETGDSRAAKLISKLFGKGRNLGSFSEELQKTQADFDALKIKVDEGRKNLNKQVGEVEDLVAKEQVLDEGGAKDRKIQRVYSYGDFIRRLRSDISTTNPTHEELTVQGYRKDSSIDKMAAVGGGERSDVFSEDFDPDATAYRDLHNQGFQFEDSNDLNPDTKEPVVYIKEGEHTPSLKPAFEANANLGELVKDILDRLHSDKEMSVVSEAEQKQLDDLMHKAFDESERLKREIKDGTKDKEGQRLKKHMIEGMNETFKHLDTVVQEMDAREQRKKSAHAV